MAIYKNHKPSPLLRGLSQTLTEDFKVFTDKNNVTRIQERKKRNSANASAGQIAHQQLFQEASDYATLNTNNSFYVAESVIRKLNAYQLAVADFMKTPSIAKIKLVNHETPGNLRLEIAVNHCCLLADLRVTISDNTDQTLILIPEQSAQLANELKNRYSVVFLAAQLGTSTAIAVNLHLETVSGKSVDLVQSNISTSELNSSIYRP